MSGERYQITKYDLGDLVTTALITGFILLGACFKNEQTVTYAERSNSSPITTASTVPLPPLAVNPPVIGDIAENVKIAEAINEKKKIRLSDDGPRVVTLPSQESIESWLQLGTSGGQDDEKTKMNGEIDIKEFGFIALTDGRWALLARTVFSGRGRDDIYGALLILAEEEKVRDVSEIVGYAYEFKDMDDDGITEIVTTVSREGDGMESGTRSILHFDAELNPIVLHHADFRNRMQFSQESTTAVVGVTVDVKWEFIDIPNADGEQYLVEESLTRQHAENVPDKSEKTSSTYRLMDGKFVKVQPQKQLR